jgi:hypothetical protein
MKEQLERKEYNKERCIKVYGKGIVGVEFLLPRVGVRIVSRTMPAAFRIRPGMNISAGLR